MTLPSLHALSLSSESADTGVPVTPPSKAAATGECGRTNTKWMNWVLRDTWSGVPGGMGFKMAADIIKAFGSKEKALAAAYSPNGEWEQREMKVAAVLTSNTGGGLRSQQQLVRLRSTWQAQVAAGHGAPGAARALPGGRGRGIDEDHPATRCDGIAPATVG